MKGGLPVLAISLILAGPLFAASADPHGAATAEALEPNSVTVRLPGETDAAYRARAAGEKAAKARASAAASQAPWYGQVLFSDDTPAVVADAKTTIRLSSKDWSLRLADLQEDGAFEVRLLKTETEQIGSGQMRLIVTVPGSSDEDFPLDLLRSDKTKAGILKVPRPASAVPASMQAPAEAISLLAKPLPGFAGIEPAFDPNQAKGKRLLVCLWDMNQRPSRRMVDELVKRADPLKAANVQVAMIQVSRIDPNGMRTWLTDHKVGFPVGTALVDEFQLRRTWPLDTVPWMILTDPNHVVKAEGFGLDQLDAALKAGDLGTLPSRPASRPSGPAATQAAEPQVQDPNWQKGFDKVERQPVAIWFVAEEKP